MAKEPDQCWWEGLFVPVVYPLPSQDAVEEQASMAGSTISLLGLRIVRASLYLDNGDHSERKEVLLMDTFVQRCQ